MFFLIVDHIVDAKYISLLDYPTSSSVLFPLVSFKTALLTSQLSLQHTSSFPTPGPLQLLSLCQMAHHSRHNYSCFPYPVLSHLSQFLSEALSDFCV